MTYAELYVLRTLLNLIIDNKDNANIKPIVYACEDYDISNPLQHMQSALDKLMSMKPD